MLKYNFETFFPELAGVPKKTQQDIVEQARYETFTTVKGSNGKFVLRFFGIAIFSLIAAQIISHFSGINNTLALSIAGGLGAVFSTIHWQQKSWARQIHPKVQELAERYRSDKKLQGNI